MAERVWEYGVPATPAGNELVVMLTGGIAGAMLIVNPCDAAALILSVTVMANVDEPATVGVPLIPPVEGLSAKPAGRAPEVIEKLYGGVPLAAPTACE